MILPGWISETKNSGLPLPLPMRTCRLLRDRLVREHADPDAASALDVARHRPAGSFQLPRRQPAAGGRLEAELAERYLGAEGRDPGIVAFLLLAIFGSCRLQHDSSLVPPSSSFYTFFGSFTVVL